MALKGNLRDFTATQLLNLIHLARKTGTLIVEGSGVPLRVFFREGKLAYAKSEKEEDSLVNILFRANKISASQHRAIRQHASLISDKELGLLLINANYLTQQEIINCLQHHFIYVLNSLFTWVEGLFRFEPNLAPPEGKITVRVSLENIIVEGARRLREWEQLQDEIPSLDMALKFSDRPGANLRNINLSMEEWRVVNYINPKNTMHQIAQASKLNEIEIRRIVYGLLQAGLVEIVRPTGSLDPAQGRGRSPAPLTPGAKKEQVSLVNRIIRRIRAL
ncbi:MAG TPA: DUF4388 domain-containing protein [Anaerolineales bacterium]|nr:DUF4388 domain-containing protein [Anaerolineales bacterium]